MPPINPSRLPALFNEGRQAEAKGNATLAKQRYESVLAVNPNLAEVQFQLGHLLLKTGQAAQAAQHLDRAADLRPSEKAIWQVYARAVQSIADPDRTARFLKKAKAARLDRKLLISMQETLRPKGGKSRISLGSVPPADVERAVALLQSGKLAEAGQLVGRLFKDHPNVAVLADMLGHILSEIGDAREAETHFRRAIELAPNYPETRANFGQFLLRHGRLEEAVTILRSALDLLPEMPGALQNLGIALRRLNRYKAATSALRRALELDPGLVLARMELAESLLSDDAPAEAETVVQPLLTENSPNAASIELNARILAALKQDDAALAEFDQAATVAPGMVKPIFSKALFLQSLGRFEDAEDLLRQVMELDPKNGESYQALMISRKCKPDDPLIERMAELFDDPEVTAQNRMYFGFALAKAMEDTGRYDRVFTYLRPANDYVRDTQPYDRDARRGTMQDYMSMFADLDFSTVSVPDATSFAPIFVTGLPRSGTTLVEQIVASHSRVAGGGELGIAHRELAQAIGGPKDRAKGFQLSGAELSAIGHQIASEMRAVAPEAEIVTDKGVQSYLLIGPIKLALPASRMVIVNRDPRDGALSMYKNHFKPGRHLYTYSLSDLAAYYRDFRRIVDFWREKTPDWIYEIQYEDLIANPEEETRKLIAACGLDWEDACLSFYENKRRVDTLSVHQVRQPLYSSSMQAWRRYEDDLTELLEGLGGEYAPGAS